MRADYFRIAYGVSRFELRLMAKQNRVRRSTDFTGGPAELYPATKPCERARTQLGFVDFIAFARSSRFGEVVSGAKQVRFVKR